MSITLLTAVPGGGKTSYAVWHVIKKAHEEGKIIYTCGIPKLKIPTIEITIEQVRKWYEATTNDQNLPELVNLEHGSILVIDEVQKIWPATGSKITEDIKDLSVHRHYGLSFFLITQSPNLIHRNVLALVDRHLHIRPTWAGRKIYEWAEYCRNPSAKSNKDAAITFNYKLPKESFQLYHSATQHVKPIKRVPMSFYVFTFAIILTIAFGYYASTKVLSKTQKEDDSPIPSATAAETVPEKVVKEEKGTQQENIVKVSQPVPAYFDTQLLTASIDWSKISACLSNKSGCVCYGLSAERLVVPKESCELAVQNGWSKATKKT